MTIEHVILAIIAFAAIAAVLVWATKLLHAALRTQNTVLQQQVMLREVELLDEKKREIYGRKTGTQGEYALLISSDGASSGGKKADPKKLREFELANTRRAVATLRAKGVEGYVIFVDDPQQYKFTPSADFIYPAQP